MEKYTAIVLAGGSGKRMNAKVHKQYLEVAGKPVIYYALRAFEESDADDIVLVCGAGEESYCRTQIVEKYQIKKVKAIVAGGKERYHSVYQGLLAAEGADYVLIHDGARPLVDTALIEDSMKAVKQYKACVSAVPVKDTIKSADEDQFAEETLERSKLWQIQTPQTFSYELIKSAYQKMLEKEDASITDDAMVVEKMTQVPIKLIQGDYRNIKITTPEDLPIAEIYLAEKQKIQKNKKV